MFIKTGWFSIKKESENAFGDCILTKRYKEGGRVIAVLSDGLGSGIKANILSRMTSVMLLKFAENNSDLIKAGEIVMNSLPICKVRGISYSTFSIVVADELGNIKIIEEGNPDFLLIRNNEIVEVTPKIIDSKTHKERHLKVYNFSLKINDTVVFMSDGITQAALGSKNLPLGLTREGVIKIILEYIKNNPNFTPCDLAFYITNFAKSVCENNKTKDDTSALIIKAVEPINAIIFTGPPYNSEQDNTWAQMFKNFEGKKAISGGTTAKILSRELNRELVTSQNTSYGALPDISFMEGADLVTEGILTLTKTLQYLEDETYKNKKNSASKLVEFLLFADNINFIVGAKVNTAHYDPNLPVEIELRKDVVKKIANLLKEKYLKKVAIQYM